IPVGIAAFLQQCPYLATAAAVARAVHDDFLGRGDSGGAFCLDGRCHRLVWARSSALFPQFKKSHSSPSSTPSSAFTPSSWHTQPSRFKSWARSGPMIYRTSASHLTGAPLEHCGHHLSILSSPSEYVDSMGE